MKCQHCGNERIKEKDNFCGYCGKKIKTECNCWIKKDSYNCGEDSCPGLALLVKEARAERRRRYKKRHTDRYASKKSEYLNLIIISITAIIGWELGKLIF